VEPAPASARGRRIDRALAVLVAAALTFSAWTYARLPATRPSGEDYLRAADHVRAHFAPGDLVELNPWWATRARELLGDLPVQQHRRVDREDLGPHPRVWLLSLFGAEGRPEVRRGLDGRAALLEERRFGRIDLRLYALPAAAPVLLDFRRSLPEARAWMERDDRTIPCDRWVAGRWQCRAEPWVAAARAVLEIGDEPREVIWTPPIDGGWSVLEWEAVPLGSRLVVQGGVRTRWARPELSPVVMEVLVDGAPAARWTFPGEPAFSRHELDTRRWAEGRHRVTFRLGTARPPQRQFAFAAEIRE
jgi:hypothetical protein